jgi:hypothetical protein
MVYWFQSGGSQTGTLQILSRGSSLDPCLGPPPHWLDTRTLHLQPCPLISLCICQPTSTKTLLILLQRELTGDLGRGLEVM